MSPEPSEGAAEPARKTIGTAGRSACPPAAPRAASTPRAFSALLPSPRAGSCFPAATAEGLGTNKAQSSPARSAAHGGHEGRRLGRAAANLDTGRDSSVLTRARSERRFLNPPDFIVVFQLPTGKGPWFAQCSVQKSQRNPKESPRQRSARPEAALLRTDPAPCSPQGTERNLPALGAAGGQEARPHSSPVPPRLWGCEGLGG